MTPADVLRLHSFAAWRVRGLGRKSDGRTADDLINEAVRAALDGTRYWNRNKVDFMGFLTGAIQSISDGWGRRYPRDTIVAEADVVRADPDGTAVGALDRVAAPGASQEDDLVARERLARVRSLFDDDPVAALVVAELEDGARLPEIRERHGLTENELNAALKRIRRRVARASEEGRL